MDWFRYEKYEKYRAEGDIRIRMTQVPFS